jgi:hypothetical protein
MAQTDLYPILRAYANKSNSPYIDIDVFLDFLEKYALRKMENSPEWGKWTSETGVKFWSEMSGLVESGKCALMADVPEGRIYMPFYYVDLLQEAYRSVDDSADSPFPSEDSLHITIPDDQIRIVNLNSELEPFFGGEEKPPLPIIKLIFPDGFGSALILAPMIPRRLMEAALLKVRHYLRGHGNKEFAVHKLGPQLAGKEKYLRETIDQVMIRPLDCLNSLETYGDFSWLFWSYFCALVKIDIKKKKEALSEDIAAIQAVYTIEICNSFYKARAMRQREKEMAFRELEMRLEKPPCYFNMDAIAKFTNSKGTLLLGLYSREDLENYIKKRTTESKDELLPEWFILQGKNGERWFVKKDKFLPLCARLLIEARPLIKKAITSRWVKLIKQFHTEAAMDRDADFDKLLSSNTEKIMPVLMDLLQDEKLLWVYEEIEHTQGVIPSSSRIFSSGKLIPMNALYVIRRKDILTDAKLLLPFWYSTPILTAIIKFFKNLGKKKKKVIIDEDEETEEEKTGEKETARDIRNAAEKVQAQLVPKGKTLDVYLTELEARWSRLLNKQARADLVADVNSLVRDYLRKTVRVHKSRKITTEGLAELADSIVEHTTALQSLGGQDSLRLYMELFMIKMLLTIKM